MDNIEYNLADTLIERPHVFEVGGQQFFLYPVTLGKSYLLMRLIESLEFDEEIFGTNPCLEALRVCNIHRDIVLRIISYHTIKNKEELFDNSIIDSRCKFFSENLDNEELAQLLLVTLYEDKTSTFKEYLGINKENEWKHKISKLKGDSGSSVCIGGKSIYGSMIDYICERYKWQYDYVVWGISYANIKMLMSDCISTYYLSKEELKQLRMPTDRTIVSGDSKENIQNMKRYFKD